MGYSIELFEHGSHVVFAGKITLEQINRANGDLYRNPKFDQHTFQIFDFTDADTSLVAQSDVEEPAATDMAAALSVPNMKVACIATDPTTFDMCQQYIEHLNDFGATWEGRIFSALKDAWEWVAPTP